MRWLRDSRFTPISAYGVIGDMRTAALVGADGSIDWWCPPRFDSPSVFGAILDLDRGGRFRVEPVQPYTAEQRYFPLTNILVTSFHLHDGSGVAELVDFMPSPEEPSIAARHEIHRRVRGVRGSVELEVTFAPRFDYGRAETRLRRRRDGVHAWCDGESLAVASPDLLDWAIDEAASDARARFRVAARKAVWLVTAWGVDEEAEISADTSQARLATTAAFWNGWAGALGYTGMYRAEVERSALALKLLFYEPTGAVVAAATTALPEEIGGVRNWDYRYCWLRDAAFTLSAFNIVGLHDEAQRFMAYLKWIAGKSDGPLQIMYGVGGERDLTEHELTHLSGYRDSRPVRIGNGAHDQLQLDVYGELLSAVHLWHQQNLVDAEFWQIVTGLVDWVADNWQQPDSSIWEVRAEPRHYVFSKVMCWVALDRAIGMAEALGAPDNLKHWITQRDAVRSEILERGWDDRKQAFVQYYGGDALDAANLLIPFYGFLAGDDPRMKGTIAATLRELTRDGMLYRYTSEDGLPGNEGVFSICTFWLADALILSGDVEGGERVFRRMLRFSNSLGLYSEQIDPRTGDMLGNFPQAFTHIALINTAHLLEQAYAEAARREHQHRG